MSASAPRVIVGTLHRERTVRVRLKKTPTPPKPPRLVVRRPAKVARLLALAHHIERAITAGTFADAADIARRLGFTRARLSQLLNLLHLAPDIQEAVLLTEAVDGREPLSEHILRPLCVRPDWAQQRAAWASLGVARAVNRRGGFRGPQSHEKA